MKRLILICVTMLCLVPPGVWAESSDEAIFEVTCSRDEVEEFMAAFALTCPIFRCVPQEGTRARTAADTAAIPVMDLRNCIVPLSVLQ